MRLRPVTFAWNEPEKYGNRRELGFIAQEVEPIVPAVVGALNDGMLSIDYPKLTALLTAAIQELTARVVALESIQGDL
jgi:hypothetical protein